MSRLCTICSLPPEKRQEIDAALLVHEAGYRNIAKRYGVDYQALYLHERTHLRHTIQESKALGEMLSADNLLAKLGELDEVTRAILTEAREGKDPRTALAAIRESRGNIESFAHIGPLSDVEQRLRALEAQKEGGTGTDGNTTPGL